MRFFFRYFLEIKVHISSEPWLFLYLKLLEWAYSYFLIPLSLSLSIYFFATPISHSLNRQKTNMIFISKYSIHLRYCYQFLISVLLAHLFVFYCVLVCCFSTVYTDWFCFWYFCLALLTWLLICWLGTYYYPVVDLLFFFTLINNLLIVQLSLFRSTLWSWRFVISYSYQYLVFLQLFFQL